MDSYALCPCGSGKKVKFCCQAILPEMSKIERLQENNQPRMALQQIDKLLKDHSQNAWLVNQRALALLADERPTEARDTLVAFLHKHPDHPLSNALLALAMTELEPVENCKKVIHRAFLKSMTAEPRVTALLAGKLVSYFLDTDRDMAARQHMAIVLRLEGDEQRQRTIQAMLELDSDTSIPYPLRGGHPLPHFEPLPDEAPVASKAQRVFMHGCFAEAAALFEQIAAKREDVPELWQTIGLLHAWDGNESAAAKALHRAAALSPDFDKGVEIETLAQLLDRRQPEQLIQQKFAHYDVESVSRLLTRLDNEDRLVRSPRNPMAPPLVSAVYEILDQPLPADPESLTLESAPTAIGSITVLDQSADTAARLIIVSLEGSYLEEAGKIVEQAGGDLLKKCENPEEAEADFPGDSIVAEERELFRQPYLPNDLPLPRRSELRRESLERSIQEVWPNRPQAALDGKSPIEASGDPSLKLRLAAALQVLDALVDCRGILLDLKAYRQRLNLPEPAPIPVTENLDVNALSITQLQQLNLSELTDEQMERVRQRASVVRNALLGYRVFSEFVERRPQLHPQRPGSAQQACLLLSELCRNTFRLEEAISWFERGQALAQEQNPSFETQLTWKLRELTIRSWDPDRTRLKSLLVELWNHFGSKVPEIREELSTFVADLGIDPPWSSAIVTPEAMSAGTPVWGAESGAASSASKLWLPD